MADGENSEGLQGGKVVFRETRKDRLEFDKRMAEWRRHMREEEDKQKVSVSSNLKTVKDTNAV